MKRRRNKYIVTNVAIQSLIEKKKVAEDAFHLAGRELDELRQKCNHKYIPEDVYDPKDEWFSSMCFCPECGDRGETWWCPKSPDGLCNYEHAEGRFDEDDCIFCHMPDERK